MILLDPSLLTPTQSIPNGSEISMLDVKLEKKVNNTYQSLGSDKDILKRTLDAQSKNQQDEFHEERLCTARKNVK